MSSIFKENEEIFGLRVDETTKAYMLETMRWTKFAGIIFSVLMILVCGLIAFMLAIYMPDYLQQPVPNVGATLTIMIIIVAGINFYPIFALLRFSALIKKAIQTNNQPQFNNALRYLKNLFKYIGIFTIVMITFYGVAIGVSIMAGK